MSYELSEPPIVPLVLSGNPFCPHGLASIPVKFLIPALPYTYQYFLKSREMLIQDKPKKMLKAILINVVIGIINLRS